MGVTLPWQAMQPFGVVIDRDFSAPFSPSEAWHLRQLLHEHGLILARGQALSIDRHREVCAMIGPILLREGEGEAMSNEGGGPSASELAWHADAAYTPYPFEALSLHALDVIDNASSTRFVHASDAWDRLSQALQSELMNCEQVMVSPHYTQLAGRTCDRDTGDALVRAIRPAVIRHPVTGRYCLWTSELQTAALDDMPAAKSQSLLHDVFDCFYTEEAVLEHRWRKDDLIIWDNIALQHMRRNLASVGRRVLQRVIVGRQGVAPHVAAA